MQHHLKSLLRHWSRIYLLNLEAQQTESPLITEVDAALYAAKKKKIKMCCVLNTKDTRKTVVVSQVKNVVWCNDLNPTV